MFSNYTLFGKLYNYYNYIFADNTIKLIVKSIYLVQLDYGWNDDSPIS